MNLNGTFTFNGPRERVWALLQDPAALAAALPGTERLTLAAPDRYEGVMKVSIGPLTAAAFDVIVTLTEKESPRHFSMNIDAKGSVGFSRGIASVDLQDQPDATTLMEYSSSVQVGGRIAAVGQRLVDSVASMMMRQALEALARQLTTAMTADSDRS
jgi:carbon monoxide dehydrogenase subunit G